MAQRTPSNRPPGKKRPGQRGRKPERKRPAAQQQSKLTRPVAMLNAARFSGLGATRLTGRASVLLLVLALLTVSYASSMRAYIVQRANIQELQASIDKHETNIAALERERRRWDDPAYVQQQARERFGYVMPGDISLVVIDEDGNPIDPEVELADPDDVLKKTPVAWWSRAWASVQTADYPPPVKEGPASTIDGTKAGS
jgi:cell division protein FtsB